MNPQPAPNPKPVRTPLPWREVGWSLVFVAFVRLGVTGLLPPKASELAGPARHAAGEKPPRRAPDLFALSFPAAVEQAPTEELKAPHVGWVQSVLVEPGQRVGEGEPLLRLWQQPPPGEQELPVQLTEALSAVEKAEKEKSAAKAALEQSVKRLQELRTGVDEARAKLSAARIALNEALTLVTRKAEKAAADTVAHGEKVRSWQAERDKAETALAAAKRATDEAARALEASNGKLPKAEQAEKAAREELAKRQRLFDLGVIAEVDVKAAKATHAQTQTALAAANAAIAECERALRSARGAQEKAAARQQALPPAPQQTATDTPSDFTDSEQEVAAARTEATQLQEKLTAEGEIQRFAMVPGTLKLPEKFRDLPRGTVYDYTALMTRNWNDVVKVVKDPEAESGITNRLDLTAEDVTNPEKYVLPMPWGLYGTVDKKFVGGAPIKAEDIPEAGYHWYKMGTFPVEPGYYLYFFWSWIIQLDVDNVYDPAKPDQQFECWARIKFEGPRFPHAKPGETDAICVERVVLVKAR